MAVSMTLWRRVTNPSGLACPRTGAGMAGGKRPLRYAAALAVLVSGLLPLSGCTANRNGGKAEPDAVHLLVTRALRAPLETIRGKLDAVAGQPVVVAYNSSEFMKRDILNGQAFDVAILVPRAAQSLFDAGKVQVETHEIARGPVGVGLRGEGDVDISTPEGLKAALLNARSVKYSRTGAAILTTTAMFARLGVDGKFHDSSALQTEVPLGPGEYELALYPLSEIIPNKKLRALGPLPAEFQDPVVIMAVTARDSAHAAAARALIEYLQGPAIDAALEANGLSKSTINSRFH